MIVRMIKLRLLRFVQRLEFFNTIEINTGIEFYVLLLGQINVLRLVVSAPRNKRVPIFIDDKSSLAIPQDGTSERVTKHI